VPGGDLGYGRRPMANDQPTSRTKRTGGRVTPKGGPTRKRDPGHVEAPSASTRYTPPTHRSAAPSPAWLLWVMLALFVLGVAIIFMHYADTVLPGASSNWWLFAGLGSILGGILTATQYR